MSDKKTDYSFPVFFGDRCHVGDEMLRCQYLQYLDRSAAPAAVTEVEVKPCNDQRCSYWSKHNPPTDESSIETSKNEADNEKRNGSTSVGHSDAMGPLNIMAAIIPFESTYEELLCATLCDIDNRMCSRSFDVLLSSSSESMGTVDISHQSPGSKLSSESSIEIRTFDDDDETGEEE